MAERKDEEISGRRRLGLAAAVVGVCALALASLAAAATPWTGSGSGTTTVLSDGTSAPAKLSYSVTAGCCASGSWTFSTISDVSGPVVLSWTYTGYNAFFAVRVGLSAFVTHGSTTTTPLVNAGPVNCCSPPSGGYTYTGTTTLTVAAGDTYGFNLSGSNGDSDGRVNGTLTVSVSEPTRNRTGYCAVPGDINANTGAAIPAGTFLDLVTGQPDADPHYTGAVPANFVKGEGLTCDPPPAGDVRQGSMGVNPYYAPPPAS